MNPIRIEKKKLINDIEISQCLHISNNLFGIHYHSKNYFLKKNLIKVFALNKDEIVGFFTYIISKNKTVIDCIAVDNKWQRKKIGTLFLEYFFENVVNPKDKLVAYAWKVDNLIPANNLNLKFGLKKVENLGKIWIEECNKSFHCIQFKNTCQCECVLYSN